MGPPMEWLPRAPAVSLLLDVVYRVDWDAETWSRSLTDTFAQSLGDEAATIVGGCCFDASTMGTLRTRAVASTAPTARAWLASWGTPPEEGHPEAESLMALRCPNSSRVVTARAALGEKFELFSQLLRGSLWPEARDAWSVAGANLNRQGYLLSVATSRLVAPLPPSLSRQWTRVAAHLSAAFCLRERLARGEAPSEGCPRPTGSS